MEDSRGECIWYVGDRWGISLIKDMIVLGQCCKGGRGWLGFGEIGLQEDFSFEVEGNSFEIFDYENNVGDEEEFWYCVR